MLLNDWVRSSAALIHCHCRAPVLDLIGDDPAIHRRRETLPKVDGYPGSAPGIRIVVPQLSTPMMSDSFMIRSSSPSSLTSVPDHLPNSTRSPTLMSIGIS